MKHNDFDKNSISMFDTEEDSGLDLSKTKKLDVVKFDYIGVESLTWQDLFSGFDSIFAITFSSGIQFVCRLLSKFKTAEIIFGCEGVLSNSMQEIMAYQGTLIEELRKTTSKIKEDLLERLQTN